MIALDASVVVKWFKPHERFEAEAQSLLDLIGGFKVEALASEWLSLEVVRECGDCSWPLRRRCPASGDRYLPWREMASYR